MCYECPVLDRMTNSTDPTYSNWIYDQMEWADMLGHEWVSRRTVMLSIIEDCSGWGDDVEGGDLPVEIVRLIHWDPYWGDFKAWAIHPDGKVRRLHFVAMRTYYSYDTPPEADPPVIIWED